MSEKMTEKIRTTLSYTLCLYLNNLQTQMHHKRASQALYLFFENVNRTAMKLQLSKQQKKIWTKRYLKLWDNGHLTEFLDYNKITPHIVQMKAASKELAKTLEDEYGL